VYEKAISNTRMYKWSKSETISSNEQGYVQGNEQVYVQGNEQGYVQGYDEIIGNIKNWLDLACIDRCLFLMS
jgi:hypothetical protein